MNAKTRNKTRVKGRPKKVTAGKQDIRAKTKINMATLLKVRSVSGTCAPAPPV